MDETKIRTECIQEDIERSGLISILNSSTQSGTQERSLNKTTKVVNRLKKYFSDPNPNSLIEEMRKLDLSMYVEEVVSALIEVVSTMKLRDTPRFMQLLVNISCMNPRIVESFYDHHSKLFAQAQTDNLRLRIFIRVLTEGLLLNVAPPQPFLAELVNIFKTSLTAIPPPQAGASNEIIMVKLNALVYWIQKYHAVILGVTALGGESYPSFPTRLPDQGVTELNEIIGEFYFKKLSVILKNIKNLIENQEARHKALMINKGVIEEEDEAKLLNLRNDFERINNFSKIFEIIFSFEKISLQDEEVQETPETLHETDSHIHELTPEEKQFSDESERSFYLDLIDLKSRLPSTALELGTGNADNQAMESFLSDLTACTLAEDADTLSIKFFESHLYTASNLKKLSAHFLSRTSMIEYVGIQPAQIRFLANLSSIVGVNFGLEIADEIFRIAKNESSKAQIAAIKTIGEMIKFSLCPLGVFVKLLRRFIDNFDAHNAEMASWLLGACGRYSVNKSEISELVEDQLIRLMKLRNASFLPRKVEMMVDHAYYQTKPRLVSSTTQKQRKKISSVLEQYIEHLIRVDIYRMHDDTVLKLIRKLPWKSQYDLIANCMRECILDFNGNFEKTDAIASLLAGLIKYEESFVVDIIDTMFEQFQIEFEREDFRRAPVRVRMAKFFAELYVYKLIDANCIFDLLFQLIGFRDTSSYGAGEYSVLLGLVDDISGSGGSAIMHPGMTEEPSWSNTRIILVNTILKTCGEFLVSGPKRIKLKRFLILLRRYMWLRCESKIPAKISNLMSELFDSLRLPLYDVRNDSLERIDSDLHRILEELRSNNGIQSAVTSEEDSGDSHSEDEGSFGRSSLGYEDADEYARETPTHIDDFEREFQSMMIESVAEGRGKRTDQLLGSLNKPIAMAAIGEPTGDEIGTFRVLSRSGDASTTILVPESNKLNLSQERYKQELEAAAREKAFLKRYILDYQRQESSAADPSMTMVPSVARAFPSLGEYDEFREPADHQAANSAARFTRRKYRKL